MNELLMQLLQAIITAVVPVLAAYLVTLIKAKTAETAAKMESAKAKGYLQEISDAVATAVTFTSQTYVDKLKLSDSFTAENQAEALRRSKEKAIDLLSKSALAFISETYRDATDYIESRVEQEVRLQKDGVSLMSPVTEILT